MKSRTSSSKLAAFRKDITRFAPAWALYTLFLFLCLVLLINCDSDFDYNYCSTLADSIILMPMANLCYALLCGELLFGDLFSSRMCNALHAMPPRRESWFLTHVLSGLFFSFVPNLLFAAINCLLLGQNFSIALYWLLAVCLQYLFFFGLAVLAALCVGNRFAMALVYGILNFLSLLIYWLVSTLYEPLLYGIQFEAEPFLLFCPVVHMCQCSPMDVWQSTETTPDGVITRTGITAAPLGDWWYLWVCAAIGLVFLVLALLLYRRRKLECAGDFMAEPKAAPVFLVLYSLMAGTVFQLFFQLFTGWNQNYLFLAIGIVVGFFTGQMLLKRTLRVFQLKSLLGLVALAAALGLSLGLTALDPIGITRYVPEAEDVASVSVAPLYSGSACRLESAEDIENILEVHRAALENRQAPDSVNTFTLTYTLKSGAQVRRYYSLDASSEASQVLRGYFSRPESVLGPEIADLENFLSSIQDICIDGETWLDKADFQSFTEAVLLDCQAGTMAQSWYFHDWDGCAYWVEFCFITPSNSPNRYMDIQIFESCANTVAWLEEHGIPLNIY